MSTNAHTNTTTSTPQSNVSSAADPQRTAEAKAAFEASLYSAGATLDTELQSRAKILASNSTAISKQETDLDKATHELYKQRLKLEETADRARERLKEVGDVQNWAEMIERDLLVVEETLRLAEESEEREAAAVREHDAGNATADVLGERPEAPNKRRWW